MLFSKWQKQKMCDEDILENQKMMKKPEFSKIVLATTYIIWIAGAIFGGYIVSEHSEHIESYFAYLGSPTITAIGFYVWKAKAENIIKIPKLLERDKKISAHAKKQIISSIAKSINNIETEDDQNYGAP